MTFKPISKADFFAMINDHDVCYRVVGCDYSKEMVGEFKHRNGTLIGRDITNCDTDSDDYGTVTYEIVDGVSLKGFP